MKIVGLTGSIATGKSTVSKIFRDLGVDVLDADIFAREVVTPHSFGLYGILQHFGAEIFDGPDNLDRAKLRQKIIEDATRRKVLENITHPLIQWRFDREVEFLSKQNRDFIIYDAALIFEKNLLSKFHQVVVVSCTAEQQFQRLMKREKIDMPAAEKIISSQWPIEKKAALANFVIDNSETIEHTTTQVKSLIEKLKCD